MYSYILLALRVLIGVIFLYHGYPKGVDWGMGVQKFQAMGLPGWLGPATGVMELACGIAMLLGWMTRFVGPILAAIMVGAIVTVQLPSSIDGGVFGCGLERDLLILLICLGFPFTGPGKWSLSK